MDEEEICLFNASGVVLCDYKFTGKKWSLGQLKNNLQFMLYRYMTGVQQQEIHNMRKGGAGKITKDCSDDFLAEEQDITSNLRILRTSFNADNTEYVEHVVHSVATAITSGIFTPCDPESWCCNETWCGYWNRCRGKMTGWAVMLILSIITTCKTEVYFNNYVLYNAATSSLVGSENECVNLCVINATCLAVSYCQVGTLVNCSLALSTVAWSTLILPSACRTVAR